MGIQTVPVTNDGLSRYPRVCVGHSRKDVFAAPLELKVSDYVIAALLDTVWFNIG